MNNSWDQSPIWHTHDQADGTLSLEMNDPNRAVNLLSYLALEEVLRILTNLRNHPPKALIIRSGKPAGFIAGADITAFEKEQDPARMIAYVRLGHEVMDALAALPIPTIAVIHGHALGGGLELALACHSRIAVDASTTRMGLPEVLLGIHPGFGGSVRLPQLIGHAKAMEMMLSGRTLSAQEALRIGMVDAISPARQLEATIRALIAQPPKLRALGFWSKSLAHLPLRPIAAWAWRKATAAKAAAHHYPAPHALIDLWQQQIHDPTTMLIAERESVTRLAMTPTARHLTRLFFLRERLKGLGKESCSTACHLHVVGAGTMGGDIAAWCALKGMTVTVQDANSSRLGPMFLRAGKLFAKKAGGFREAKEAMDRLMPDPKGDGIAKADLIIEAISENLTAKKMLLRQLEPRMRPDAILATNTSALSLQALASVLQKPERLVGIHFFNPVDKMQLIEVVAAPQSSEAAILRGCAFAVSIDRLPLPVKDAPGFLINRLLMPYLLEAVLLAEEGVSVAAIDGAARQFGMPMGPLLLADQVGLDIVLSVAETLSAQLNCPTPKVLHDLVAKNHLGKKTGSGFYQHRINKPAKPIHRGLPAPSNVVDRLILPMINTGMTTLREGIVTDGDLLDAGMVFGTGFAPFRGGPLSYIRSLGQEESLHRLQTLAAQLGPRFTIDAGWQTFDFWSDHSHRENHHEHKSTPRSGDHFTPLGQNVVRLVPRTG